MTANQIIKKQWTSERIANSAFLVLFTIQACWYFNLLLSIPLHYDEWMSFYSYSGNDFKAVVTSYSSTNNHIFYNLLAHFFVLFPFSDEIGVRLPAYLSSLACTYFFHRLCKMQFSAGISFLLTALLSGSYLFIMYSVEARGYSLLLLFFVLLLYGLNHLSTNYRQIRYRVMFVVSTILGLWSIPTFLYALLPVWIFFIPFIYKQGKRLLGYFILDTCTATILVAFAYAPVFLLNDVAGILSEQGEDKLFWNSTDFWLNVLLHSKGIVLYLFRSDYFNFWVSIIILIPLLNYLAGRRKLSFLAGVSYLVFISPYLYILFSGLVPYSRVWVYILVAGYLCIGFFLDAVLVYLRGMKTVFKPMTTALLFLAIICFYSWTMVKFKTNHRENTSWDYELAEVREQKLGSFLTQVNEISSTNKGFEFYPAGILLYYTKAADRSRNVRLTTFDSLRGQDLLLLDWTEAEKLGEQLKNYELIYKKEGLYFYKINSPLEPRH